MELTESDREALADACDAMYDFGDTWIRFIRNGNEDNLLPTVARIAAKAADEREAEVRARVEDAFDPGELDCGRIGMTCLSVGIDPQSRCRSCRIRAALAQTEEPRP